jgi:site-specific DNA-methyltransferase (adenine-specific)
MTVTILQGDCLATLKTLDAGSADVGVTSPPYNLGGDFHSSSVNDGKRRSFGGYEDFDDNLPEPEYQAQQIEVLNELHRVIKPSGWLFYVHKNRIKNGRIISPLEWLLKTNWIVYQDVVVNMTSTANVDKRRFFPVHEFVFVLSASDGAILDNSNCLTSVWKFPQVNRKDTGHPAAFHPGLPRICLEASAKDGDVVIDPYMGSGTTGKVAQSLGMSFVGIERNSKYFAIARDAIENRTDAAIALSLFSQVSP